MTTRLLAGFIAFVLALSGAPPASAMRVQTPTQSAGLEELDARLRSGQEEFSIWPDTTPVRFSNIEPILILRAEGGYGDIAYLVKVLDSFNAREVTPVVAVVGTRPEQEEALGKLAQLKEDIQVKYVLWREMDGRLVREDGSAVPPGRTLRPVLIQHFSQVNPGWARDTAERIVPDLFEPLYRKGSRFLLVGCNAPGNVFGGYLRPDQGEYLNLYLTPAAAPGFHEPHPIYTGHLFDRPLRILAEALHSTPRAARRAKALEAVERKVPGLSAARGPAEAGKGWAYLYYSQGGSIRQMECLIRAFRAAHGTATFFTSFGENPRRWYYPGDYWVPHARLVARLQSHPDVNFTNLAADGKTGRPLFDSTERPDAPVQIINLPPLSMGAVRSLMGASDLVLAPGHNTWMEAMGMAVAKAGAPVLLSFAIFRAEQRLAQRRALQLAGGGQALKTLLAFDRLRDPAASVEDFNRAADKLAAVLQSKELQERYQARIGHLSTLAASRSGRFSDANMGNRMMEVLLHADRNGSLDPEALGLKWGGASSPSVEEIRAYQSAAEASFRRGQEPALPSAAAGLEEPAIWDEAVSDLRNSASGGARFFTGPARFVGKRVSPREVLFAAVEARSGGAEVGYLPDNGVLPESSLEWVQDHRVRGTLFSEYEQGETLWSMLSRWAAKGPPSKDEDPLWVFRSLGRRLAQLEAAGINHGEISPVKHILVDEQDRSIRLIDFGLADFSPREFVALPHRQMMRRWIERLPEAWAAHRAVQSGRTEPVRTADQELAVRALAEFDAAYTSGLEEGGQQAGDPLRESADGMLRALESISKLKPKRVGKEQARWVAVTDAVGDLRTRISEYERLLPGDAEESAQEKRGRMKADMIAGIRALRTFSSATKLIRGEREASAARALGHGIVSTAVEAQGWSSLDGIEGFGKGDYLVRSEAKLLANSSRLVVQHGLKNPASLPAGATLVKARAITVAEMIPFLADLQLQPADGILFNLDHFLPGDIKASLPVEILDRNRLPGIAALFPEDSKGLTGSEIAYILAIARSEGSLYIYHVQQVKHDGQTYLLIQA
ncbi:MAG: hypothetical protein HYZ94_02045 [Candidatus Omnitrophica bacterium]|nr:hypothetical protein [Candidatus Omnitrophota bacterium]